MMTVRKHEIQDEPKGIDSTLTANLRILFKIQIGKAPRSFTNFIWQGSMYKMNG